MASLAEQRAAIGAGFSGARAATGAAERAAIHRGMVRDRTGRNIQSDLNALAPSPRKQAGLRQLEQPGARPATSSPALNRKQPAQATGGGIASPLTEDNYAAREWWEAGIPSADGLLMLPALKAIAMTDANGAEVVFNYAAPV